MLALTRSIDARPCLDFGLWLVGRKRPSFDDLHVNVLVDDVFDVVKHSYQRIELLEA